MYTKPNDGGNGPIKSIPQQSKISMTRIGFKGNMWCFEIDPNFWQCVIPDNEVSSVIKFCHSKACGGHFSSKKTTAKILQCGFYWLTIFKDMHAFCKTCENCQKVDIGQKVLLYNS